MPGIAKKRSTPSPVTLAFAAALAAAPAVAPSAGTLSMSAPASDTQIVPSAAALERMNTLTLTMLRPGPQWIEVWPEVTHVEAIKR